MKFYSDEHIDPIIGDLLEEKGHEVTRTNENELGLSDQEHVQKALKNESILITMDDDFLKIASKTDNIPGVVFITGYYEPKKIARSIDSKVGDLTAEQLKNSTIYVS